MLAVVAALLSVSIQAGPSPEPAPWLRRVAQLAPAVEHYQALGFRVARREASRTTFAVHGGVALVLEQGVDPVTSTADRVAEPGVLVVAIGSAGEVRARLDAAHVPFEMLIARPSGIASLRVRDPDGHLTILRPRADLTTPAIPAPGELGPIVMELCARYATDGAHRYHWPKSGGWKGNTKDLVYEGEVFAAGDPEGRCYCCGLTFEVLLDAWRAWCARNGRPWRIASLDLAGVRVLQQQWFGSAADPSCLHSALVDNGLGYRITDWDDACPGDFVQLWRASGSGHSVVFVAWVRAGDRPDGEITGIRYWSTQGATNGIGQRTESFLDAAGEKRVLRDRFWLCRVGDPAAR